MKVGNKVQTFLFGNVFWPSSCIELESQAWFRPFHTEPRNPSAPTQHYDRGLRSAICSWQESAAAVSSAGEWRCSWNGVSPSFVKSLFSSDPPEWQCCWRPNWHGSCRGEKKGMRLRFSINIPFEQVDVFMPPICPPTHRGAQWVQCREVPLWFITYEF